jgi:hypothetical protein
MDASHFETLDRSVRRYLMDALTLTRGNLRKAAVLLGVSRWRLARLITRYDLRGFVASVKADGHHVTETPVAAEAAPEASTSGQQQAG